MRMRTRRLPRTLHGRHTPASCTRSTRVSAGAAGRGVTGPSPRDARAGGRHPCGGVAVRAPRLPTAPRGKRGAVADARLRHAADSSPRYATTAARGGGYFLPSNCTGFCPFPPSSRSLGDAPRYKGRRSLSGSVKNMSSKLRFVATVCALFALFALFLCMPPTKEGLSTTASSRGSLWSNERTSSTWRQRAPIFAGA